MKTIETKAYGPVQVDEANKIVFVREIFGFKDSEFYIIEISGLPNFYWLQSSENTETAFVIVDPRLFYNDYELSIDDIDKGLLQLEEDDGIIDFVIVNLSECLEGSTMNLLGPVVINETKRIGIQAISTFDHYETRTPLFNQKKENETGEDE